MPIQTRLGFRLFALVNSLLLVIVFIAYRAGYLSADKSVVFAPQNEPAKQTPMLSDIAQLTFQVDPSKGLVPNPSESEELPFDAKPKIVRAAESKPVPTPAVRTPVQPVQSDPPTVMAGSKSVVLINAKSAKERAVEQLQTFESLARESFDSRDRNRDGKLTKDELDDRVWARCLEHQVVNNDAVAFEGFLKMFEWYSNQTSLEPPKPPKADLPTY